MINAQKIEQRAIDSHGRSRQLLKAIEELGELTQAIARLLAASAADRPAYEALVDQLMEEVADVEVMLDQIKLIFPDGALRVAGWKTYKLARLDLRLDKEARDHD